MTDPLADVVLLLQPAAPFSKVVSAAGQWRVRRSQYGRPFYCRIFSTGDLSPTFVDRFVHMSRIKHMDFCFGLKSFRSAGQKRHKCRKPDRSSAADLLSRVM